MAVSLSKGNRIDLSKQADNLGITLSNVNIGLGWDCNENYGSSFDLDAWALAFKETGASSKDLVYFANRSDSTRKINHCGDNLTGEGDGDDETITIQLNQLNVYKYILIGVTIFKASSKGQSFKDIDNTFIRIYDNSTGIEICKYSDKFKQEYGNCTSLLFGVLVNNNGTWEFIAIGNGDNLNRISDSLHKYSLDYINTLVNNKLNGGKKTMAVSLSKGGKVSLAKVAADAGVTGGLDELIVGLGWDTNKYDGGADFDLDASAFCCGDSGKVTCDEDFVFYNNKIRPGVEHQGDNRTGEGDGDDEVINVKLSEIPANINEVNFTVTINDADINNQNFGMVDNSYIRIVDKKTGTELIRYDLGEDFCTETALVVAKLYKNNGEWKFNAIGSGFAGGLAALCRNFGVNI